MLKIENALKSVELDISRLPPLELLGKRKTIDATLNELQRTPLSSFVSSPVSTQYEADFIPSYISGNGPLSRILSG